MAEWHKQNGEDTDGLVEVEVEHIDLDVKLPIWRKVCFAIGGSPYQTTNTVINFFIMIFLLEVAEIPPSYVSVIVFVGKVWDAITDPTCGYLVHRTNSRFGKFRPWILFSAPFACAAYFCFWYVPDLSQAGKFGWYFVFYCLFQGFLSGLHVPYTSLTMAMTTCQRERDSITAYRMVSEAVGVLLAVVVQGQLVSKTRRTGDCDSKTQTKEELDKEKMSYVYGAIIVVSAYMFCAITVFFGTREKKGLTTVEHQNFFQDVKLVLTFKPYVLLSVAFLFNSLALTLVQGNLALYCTHSLQLGDHFATFILVLLISAILAMPLWQRCIVKVGKKTTFAVGMCIFIPILISQLYATDQVYLYYAILVVAGLSVSVALLLPWSMLPDVLDEFMLTTGSRKDAIFYSFYVFFSKLAIGLGLGISSAVLSLGGYTAGACQQPASVGLALRLLVAPGPVIFVLIALLCLWAYPIDEKRRRQIKSEVIEWRKRHSTSQQVNTRKGEGRTISGSTMSCSYNSITSSSTGV